MKKRILYLSMAVIVFFILILILYFIFFCQRPKIDEDKINISDTTIEEPSPPDTEEEIPQTTLPHNEEDEDIDGDREEDDRVIAQNSIPRIQSVFYGEDNITDFLRTDALPIAYEEDVHSFIIISEDDDGDVLGYNIDCTHGRIEDIEMISDDSVFFTWRSPDNAEGSVTPLNTQIIVRVRDTIGEEDRITIRLALLPVEPEIIPTFYISITADPNLSGYIVEDTVRAGLGMVQVGDWDNDKQIKGYFSFHLRGTERALSEDFRVLQASLEFERIIPVGSPEMISERIDFKVFDYGESLESEDFRVGGIHVFDHLSADFRAPLRLTSDVLTSELNRAFAEGKTWFQIKTGMLRTSNHNGITDVYQIPSDSVSLLIEVE